MPLVEAAVRLLRQRRAGRIWRRRAHGLTACARSRADMPIRSGVSSTICQMASSTSRKRVSRFRPQRPRPLERNVEHVLHAAGPCAHDDDAVGEIHGFVDLMRDEEDGLVSLAPDLEQLGLHELAGLRVERGERLVHQQHDGIGGERTGQVDALLHSAGQLRRVVTLEAAQTDSLMKCSVRCVHGRAIEAVLHFHAVADVAGDGPPRQQTRLLKDDRAIDARTIDSLCHRSTRVPASYAQQAGDDVEQRRLAAAARSDDGHELAVGDRERHVGRARAPDGRRARRSSAW